MNIIVILWNELEMNKVVKVTLIWMESVARATTLHIGASCAQKRWIWWNLSHSQWARTTSITGLFKQGKRSCGTFLIWNVFFNHCETLIAGITDEIAVGLEVWFLVKLTWKFNFEWSFVIRFYRSARAHGNLCNTPCRCLTFACLLIYEFDRCFS